jgi:hypothetical protein
MKPDIVRHDDPTLPERATLYANENDRLRHLAYIAAIAQENHRPIPEIADCYERILSDLQRHARVHDYLNVFVAKKVFEQLKRSE